MDSSDYWAKRAERNAERIYRYGDQKAKLVTRWFSRAQKEMQRKINDYYRKYAQDNQISYQQAKASLSDRRVLMLSLEEMQRLAVRYPQDKTIKQLLDKNHLSRAISREEFLQMQLQILATQLYGGYHDLTQKSLTKVFEDTYYRTIFDQQQFAGYGSSFNRLNTRQIEAAATTAWMGKNYSERVWGNHRTSLARYLNRIITVGITTGKSNQQMTAELQKAMGAGAYEARRLIRTEINQVASCANLAGYRENGTEKFEFLAVLDLRTSETCRDMDGRVFLVSDGRIGVNMPPLHPFCRSTTVPYVPDEELDADDTRAARAGDGQTYRVPADMKYRDWYKEHVAGNPEEQLAERKLQNGSADAKQYARYQATLGSNVPKSFDDFQRLKYTDDDGWQKMKAEYRHQNYYATHLTKDERDAIIDYVGSASYPLNVKLRKGIPLTDYEQNLADTLDAALGKLPAYQGQVIRTLQFFDRDDLLGFASEHYRGAVVTYKAFTSTSVSEGYHADPQVEIRFVSKTGRDIRAYNDKEGEILFRRGLRLRVIDVKLEGRKFVIQAEEVTDG